MDWKKWFEERKNASFDPSGAFGFGLMLPKVGLEDMYQAFKARIMDELYLRNPQPFDCDLMGDVE